MAIRGKRFWAIRTDKDNADLLFAELQEGRLRQGWGYDPAQDLRKIQDEIAKGDKWWDRLTEIQKEVLPHLRMLAGAPDCILPGDVILIPNLPRPGYFCLAEVVGCYAYSPYQLSEENAVNGLPQDYGHILPVRLLNSSSGINKYAAQVPASLRSTMRTPMRMWNLDSYKDELELLVGLANSGMELTGASSSTTRLERALDIALSDAKKTFLSQLDSALQSGFQAAEWEEPIRKAIAMAYPAITTEKTGGSCEHGADIVVRIPNLFAYSEDEMEDSPWLILIQVKDYVGEMGAFTALSQLEDAYHYYSQQGTVVELVAITTADAISKDYELKSRELEQMLKVPVKTVTKRRLMRYFAEGILSNGHFSLN